MKKYLVALMIGGMAFSAIACDDSSSCLKDDPALVTEAAKFETAVKADGVTFSTEKINDKDMKVASDCGKFAENLNNYLKDDDKREALVTAIADYPTFSGGVFGVLCGAANTVNILLASQKIVEINEVGNGCIAKEGTDATGSDAAWKADLNKSLGSLTTAEGWGNVANAAKDAAKEEASKGND